MTHRWTIALSLLGSSLAPLEVQGRQAGRAGMSRGLRQVTASLDLGFEWLIRQQLEDGSWPGATGTRATALALFTLVGEGSTERQGRLQAQVARGSRWLRGQQDPETGWFGDASSDTAAETQLLATACFLEARLIDGRDDGSPEIEPWLQRAIDQVRGLPDRSVLWPAAEDSGLPTEFLRSIRDLVLYEEQLLTKSRERPAAEDWPLVWILAHSRGRTARTRKQAEAKVAPYHDASIERSATEREIHPALLMLQTWPMFQVGGPRWKEWQKRELLRVVQSQSTADETRAERTLRGSWSSVGPDCDRLTTTALHLLTLQVYYRYERVLQ